MCISELSSGNIDVAWGGIALDQKDIDAGKFTQYGPYIHNDIVIATRNGSSVWNKLRLNGRKMCMPSTPEALAALNTDEKLVNRLGQITRLAGGYDRVLRVSLRRQMRCCAHGQHGSVVLQLPLRHQK